MITIIIIVKDIANNDNISNNKKNHATPWKQAALK